MPHAPDISTGIINLVGEVEAPTASFDNIPFPPHDMYYAVTAVDSRERDSAFSSWLYLPFCPRLKSAAYSHEEHVYVYDEETNRILRLNDKGLYLPFHLFNPGESGTKPRVSSLAWTPLNELAVCVGEMDRIDFYKPDGVFSHSTGITGKNPGELLKPVDVAFNKKGEMAVADQGNRRVQIFDMQGKYLGRLGEVYLDDPIALAFTPEGHLHVLDAAKKTCFVFKEKATHKFYYEYSYGIFKNPVDIQFTSKGIVHISDQDIQEIMTFSSNGRLLSVEQPAPSGHFGYANPQGLALDSKGRAIYVDRASSSVRILEERGTE
jgi:DNA-binding beta-propeller fold protein YncE